MFIRRQLYVQRQLLEYDLAVIAFLPLFKYSNFQKSAWVDYVVGTPSEDEPLGTGRPQWKTHATESVETK